MPHSLINALAHVCVRTSDLATTERFYVDGLGLPIQFRFTKNGKTSGYYFKVAERQFIEVFEKEGAALPDGQSALAHFCLETTDIHALRTHMVGLGFEPTEIKEGCDRTLQFWVADPNGLRFELQQYGPESLQLKGGEVEMDW